MASFREKFFKRCQGDSEDLRKQKILNYLIVGFIVLAFIIFLIFNPLLPKEVSKESEEAFFSVPIGSLIFIIIGIFVFIINNYFSRIIATYTFLIQITLLIILADSPHELLDGRSIVYFIIPIIIGSITIKPYSGLIFALLIDILMIFFGTITEIIPNIPALILFILIRVIMDISAQSIKKAVNESNNAYKRIEFLKDLFSHDINNILQNIKSSTELLPMFIGEINKNEKIKSILTILKEQIERGTRFSFKYKEIISNQ